MLYAVTFSRYAVESRGLFSALDYPPEENIYFHQHYAVLTHQYMSEKLKLFMPKAKMYVIACLYFELNPYLSFITLLDFLYG